MDNSIQSGLFDDNILCSDCDGKLGVFDDHAIEISRLLGTGNEVIARVRAPMSPRSTARARLSSPDVFFLRIVIHAAVCFLLVSRPMEPTR
jgi:hypothetical protein